MGYKIIRLDGKKDKITTLNFVNYSEAYDLLEKIYGEICCSDSDYCEITYYDIVENNQLKENNGK